MADRYWVGGTGTWSSTNTANWSTSSGGAGGASVPTASDNVFFDAGSDAGANFTVTMANSPRRCNDFTASGLDFGMTLAGTSIALTVSGSLEFPATNFTRTYTGTTTFNATTTGKTVTTNGVTLATTNFEGAGGEWTLGSALDCGNSTLNVTRGTFDTSASDYAVTAGGFSSSNFNTRTVKFNGSTLTFSGAFSFSMGATTNLTFNAGTSKVISTASNAIFTVGALTFYDIEFQNSFIGSPIIVAGNGTLTCNDLTFPSNSLLGSREISFNRNVTVNGTFTCPGGTSPSTRVLIGTFLQDQLGVPITLTCASISTMSDVDFRDITIAGAHGTLSGTRFGDCGGNTNITFDAPKTVYWNLAGGGNWSSNAWALSSGGAVSTANFPLAQDTVVIENTGLNTGAQILIDGDSSAGYYIGELDFSGRTNAMTLRNQGGPRFLENVNLTSNISYTTNGASLNFVNRSIKTFDTGGNLTNSNLVINCTPSGGVQLINNNFVQNNNFSCTHTQGTFDLNDLDVTVGFFSSSGTYTRTIDFGTGEINLISAGTTVWNTLTVTNLTVSGTPVVNVTSTGATAITVTPGPLSEANSISFNFTGGTYNLTFLNLSNHSARNVDFTGYAGTWQAIGSNVIIYGNLTLSAGMSLTASANSMLFGATSGTKTITTNGKTMDFPVTFNGAGGTWQLQDAMTLGSTRLVTFTNGIVDLNGFTLTSGTGATATGTKNITFNGGTLLLSGSGATAWNNAQPTNFTTTAGTGTGAISMTSASAKTFVGGGSTYNCNLNQGGAGDLTITGSNTFNDITNSVQPATILFTGGTTQTVSNFTLSGTSGNLIIIDSTTLSQFTLSKASGTVSVSYLDIRDSNATGGATWNAFTSNGNVDGGNNTGWIFAGGGTVYDVTILEGITAAELISALGLFPTSVVEISTASEQVSSLADFASQINEASTASEQTSASASLNSNANESATGADTVSGSADFNNQVNESTTGADETSATKTMPGQIDESAVGSDEVAGAVDFGVQIDEIATGVDQVSALADLVPQISETITAADEVSSIGSFQHSIQEAATGADQVSAGVVFVVVVLESFTGLDEISGSVDFAGLVQEAAQGQDLIVGVVNFGASVQETATGTDSASTLAIFKGTVSETATASDVASALATFLSNVSESATGADEVLAGVDFAALAAEVGIGLDQVLATGSFQHFINESASGFDTTSSNTQFGALIQELGIASDSPLARFLWELINDSQSVTWQNVQSAGATNWVVVNTSETTTWQDVPTTT